jgi:diguanylate cyclase (GGDEF)-like protein
MGTHVIFFKKIPVKITVSVGVATMKGISPHYHDLVRLADQALYQAKENGRNRVATL